MRFLWWLWYHNNQGNLAKGCIATLALLVATNGIVISWLQSNNGSLDPHELAPQMASGSWIMYPNLSTRHQFLLQMDSSNFIRHLTNTQTMLRVTPPSVGRICALCACDVSQKPCRCCSWKNSSVEPGSLWLTVKNGPFVSWRWMSLNSVKLGPDLQKILHKS